MMFDSDRFRAAVAAVLRDLLPDLDARAFYPCAVDAWDDANQLATLIPLSAASRLPPILAQVPVRPGVPGLRVKLAVGATVLLGFEGGGRVPFAIAFDPFAAATFVPADTRIDSTGTMRLGAQADAVYVASGSDPVDPGDALGRVIRYGDNVSIPTIGEIPLVVLTGTYSKVRA